MLDAFKLTAILISGILWGAWLVLMLRKKDVHPLRETLEGFSRLGWLKKVGVLFIVVQLTMFGGAKHGGTNDVDDVTSTNDVELVEGGTNDVEIVDGGDTNEVVGCDVLGAPQPMSNGYSFFGGCGALGTSRPTVTRSYRLESVLTNEGYSYAMPADGTIRGTWHLTGAYEDVQKVALDGFAFPLGSDLCTSLWAYTWGKVRPQLKNVSNEIAAVDSPMSAIPDVSRFWTAATSNDTYLLTWENFALGRIATPTNASSLIPDPSSLVSAQLELRRNGDFITRSNDVECVYRRVNPDDWDDDGIPNEDDPEPLYRAEDETHFGPHQTVPEGDDTNHYCWVDVVVRTANARVTFEGEGDSWLPDPSFIAEANATNRVMILIGKAYAVHCGMPVEIVGKSDEEIETWTSGGVLMIEWPVWFEYVSARPPLLMASPLLGSGSGDGGTTIRVHPLRMGGGDYSWTDNFCCYSFADDGTPIFNCDGTCGCGGCYTGEVTYESSGHQFSFGGWSCGCGSGDDDEPHGGDEPEDPPPTRGVSVRFSHSAVFFEDEYENAPNSTVPRRSTDVELTCYANGGPNGGTYSFEVENEDKLIRKSGSYLPRSGTLRPNETFKFKVRYEAQEASGSVGDIKAKANFTDAIDGALPVVQSELTAVEVELVTAVVAPQNPCRHRHRYGVCESVYCYLTPQIAATYTARGPGAMMRGYVFSCPIETTTSPLEITYGGTSYVPAIIIQEPTSVQAHHPAWTLFGVAPLNAGGIGLEMNFVILPLDVLFSGILVQEVPSTMGVQSGYFTHSYFDNEKCHSLATGAGVWSQIGEGNVTTRRDCAGLTYALPRMTSDMQITTDLTVGWIAGENVWCIPYGWHASDVDTDAGPYKSFAAETTQVFTIDAEGTTSVEKLANEATRDISGNVYFNGGRVW